MAFKINGVVRIDNSGNGFLGIVTATDANITGVITATEVDAKVSSKAISEQTDGTVDDVTGADELLLLDAETGSLLRVSVGEFIEGAGIGTILTNLDNLTVTGVTTIATLKGVGNNAVSVGASLIPDTNLQYDLGSSTNRFRDLYISGNTIDMDGHTLSSSGDFLLFDETKVITDDHNGNVNLTGVTTIATLKGVGTNNISVGSTLSFADGTEIIMGDSGDFSIYHDGDHTYLDETGQGNLKLRTNNFRVINIAETKTSITANVTSGVEMYFDGNKKLETTNTGVVVSGMLTADRLRSGDIAARNIITLGITTIQDHLEVNDSTGSGTEYNLNVKTNGSSTFGVLGNGAILLGNNSGAPFMATNDHHATSKKYVDEAVAGIGTSGVTSIIAGDGISINQATGDVTITNTYYHPPVFGWDHDDDNYGIYEQGTDHRVSNLTGVVDIDVQSRLRRCVINNAGVVQYYLDADDSTKKAGDWLRIVESENLTVDYTGTMVETPNTLLNVGVQPWAAGTFTKGQRVTNGGYLWECLAATSTATPAAGSVASDLTGTDGQVVVEVPAFSGRYGFSNGVHTREVRLGCNAGLIDQGFQPHIAFVKKDGTYKSAFYFGAYHAYDDAGTGSSVSGQTNTRNQTRNTFRTQAAARGTGWHIWSYLELAAIQTLFVCEFQNYNSRKSIGNGANSGSTSGVTTGQSNGNGNHSANSTNNSTTADDYMSYRGIENLYNRVWQFVDGINVDSRVVYLTNDQTAFADDTAAGYDLYEQVPNSDSSFQKELFPLADVFLPSVVNGASSTTYLGSSVRGTGSGWKVCEVGSASDTSGQQGGVFTMALNNGSNNTRTNGGYRLAYAEN